MTDTLDVDVQRELAAIRAYHDRYGDIPAVGKTRSGVILPAIAGGARQYLADGPFMDPQLTTPTALVATTIESLWLGDQFTPIFANDPKAGKIYVVEAGGVMSWGGTGTLIITPLYGGTSGVALGPTITAVTTPGTATAVPWYLRFNLVFRTIGAAGANSTCIGTGFMTTGTDGAADSAVSVTFGGTSATVDATLNKDITIRKTLSVVGSFSTQYAYIYSMN